jgi:hypothetical protein
MPANSQVTLQSSIVFRCPPPSEAFGPPLVRPMHPCLHLKSKVHPCGAQALAPCLLHQHPCDHHAENPAPGLRHRPPGDVVTRRGSPAPHLPGRPPGYPVNHPSQTRRRALRYPRGGLAPSTRQGLGLRRTRSGCPGQTSPLVSRVPRETGPSGLPRRHRKPGQEPTTGPSGVVAGKSGLRPKSGQGSGWERPASVPGRDRQALRHRRAPLRAGSLALGSRARKCPPATGGLQGVRPTPRGPRTLGKGQLPGPAVRGKV